MRLIRRDETTVHLSTDTSIKSSHHHCNDNTPPSYCFAQSNTTSPSPPPVVNVGSSYALPTTAQFSSVVPTAIFSTTSTVPTAASEMASNISSISGTPSIVSSNSSPTSSPVSNTASSTSDRPKIGAIIGIIFGVIVLGVIITLNVVLFCRKKQRYRKRTMEVGKASRVDLAEAEQNRNTFYGLNRYGENNPITSWLLKQTARSPPVTAGLPTAHKELMTQQTEWDTDTLPATTEQPSRQQPTSSGHHHNNNNNNTVSSNPWRRSVTSTSDSRSQGSMVIGSQAFWASIDKKKPLSPLPASPLSPMHTPPFHLPTPALTSAPRPKRTTFKIHNPDTGP